VVEDDQEDGDGAEPLDVGTEPPVPWCSAGLRIDRRTGLIRR
jgi:hypothetical protein